MSDDYVLSIFPMVIVLNAIAKGVRENPRKRIENSGQQTGVAELSTYFEAY
jgi:hypothetical protein